LTVAAGVVMAQETNTVAPSSAAGSPAAAAVSGGGATTAGSNDDNVRSSLAIQEQLHQLELANDKSQRESAAAAEALGHRLDLIESAVTSQKLGEMSQELGQLNELEHANVAAHETNQTLLRASIAFAVFGCLVLLFAAYLQWQMVNRVRSLAAGFPGVQALEAGAQPAALGMGESAALASRGLEQSTAQFLGAMERLERRIREMETSGTVRSLAGGDVADGAALALETGASGQNGNHPIDDPADRFSVLVSKGQTLLKLDKLDEALAAFDEALAAHPDNAEGLLGRGTALERMQRLTEAIECYDRAIAIDSSMTMAYLHKGGVFNRMERYSEALECYEQALKSQDKSPAPEPAVV
jgi:tetratricopeptide (TPR) repeat protein